MPRSPYVRQKVWGGKDCRLFEPLNSLEEKEKTHEKHKKFWG
jgi:hypothetical protein